MRAVGVFPYSREVRLIEHEEPRISVATQVKLRMLEVGVCGTDRELCAFSFGTPPPDSDHFILGHESLGQVVETGDAVSDFQPGDLVVGRVRLPCQDPTCEPCRTDHQDFCRTGKYTERGITSLHGFMTEYVIEDQAYLHPLPDHLRRVGVLVEPLTIAEKACQEAEQIQQRLPWRPTARKAVVLGAGPVGLLGAMKLVTEGWQTFLYSLVRAPNPSSRIAEAIGASYISSQLVSVEAMVEQVGRIDLVYEALGAAQLAFDVLRRLGPNGLFVFTGVPRVGSLEPCDAGALVTRMVLNNQAVIGMVNSGRQAFVDAIRDLEIFHQRWPRAVEGLITGRYPMEDFRDLVMGTAGGIKNVIRITEGD